MPCDAGCKDTHGGHHTVTVDCPCCIETKGNADNVFEFKTDADTIGEEKGYAEAAQTMENLLGEVMREPRASFIQYIRGNPDAMNDGGLYWKKRAETLLEHAIDYAWTCSFVFAESDMATGRAMWG